MWGFLYFSYVNWIALFQNKIHYNIQVSWESKTWCSFPYRSNLMRYWSGPGHLWASEFVYLSKIWASAVSKQPIRKKVKIKHVLAFCIHIIRGISNLGQGPNHIGIRAGPGLKIWSWLVSSQNSYLIFIYLLNNLNFLNLFSSEWGKISKQIQLEPKANTIRNINRAFTTVTRLQNLCWY